MNRNSRTDQIELYRQHDVDFMAITRPLPSNFRLSPPSQTSHQCYYKSGNSAGANLYEPIQTIGSGSFGKIVRIRRKCDNARLVWKELEVSQGPAETLPKRKKHFLSAIMRIFQLN